MVRPSSHSCWRTDRRDAHREIGNQTAVGIHGPRADPGGSRAYRLPVLFVEERAGRGKKAVVETAAPEGEAEQAAARADALSQMGIGTSGVEKPSRGESVATGNGRTLRLGRQTVRIHSAHAGTTTGSPPGQR